MADRSQRTVKTTILPKRSRTTGSSSGTSPRSICAASKLAGAEAFARVCHPEHGVLTAGQASWPGADDASVHTLAECALVSALKSGLNLSRVGVNLRIAINVPVKGLVTLPVDKIVREHRPSVGDWPGLMIDASPKTRSSMNSCSPTTWSRKFAEHNVRLLAIDDFGKSACFADEAEGAAVRRDEARPLLRSRLRHRQGPRADLPDGDRPRPQLRRAGGGDRPGEGVRRGGAGEYGLRSRPGKLVSVSRCPRRRFTALLEAARHGAPSGGTDPHASGCAAPAPSNRGAARAPKFQVSGSRRRAG